MKLVPVKSSNISAIGYDANSQTMEIEFRGGGVYRYSGIPPALHRALFTSPSKGKFFADFIKPRYDAVCLTPKRGTITKERIAQIGKPRPVEPVTVPPMEEWFA